MGKSKKSTAKKTSEPTGQTVAEARPIGEGKDPLAEGNTLVNPTNSEAETHYDVKQRSADVQDQEAQNKIAGQDANQRAEEHNAQAVNAPSDVPNSDQEEQDEVAAGREEPGEEPSVPDVPESDAAPADEVPSEPEVPAEDQAADAPSEDDLNV